MKTPAQDCTPDLQQKAASGQGDVRGRDRGQGRGREGLCVGTCLLLLLLALVVAYPASMPVALALQKTGRLPMVSESRLQRFYEPMLAFVWRFPESARIRYIIYWSWWYGVLLPSSHPEHPNQGVMILP